MKQIFTLLFFSFLLNGNTQVWIDQGAVWHYDFDSDLDYTCYSGYQKLEYLEDTIIDGITCQEIEGVNNTWLGDVFIGSSTFVAGYTYVNGDTVFYRHNNEFFVLYNFGTQVGDDWIISTTNNNSGYCEDTSKVTVTAIGNITINSTSYRTITLEINSAASYHLTGTFVERFGKIGGHTSWPSIFPITNQCNPNFVDEGCTIGFMCFEDDSFPLYNPNNNGCGYTVGIDNNEILDSEPAELYPNPVQNELTISITNFENLNHVTIINIIGNEVGQYTIDSNQKNINVSNLEKGIYFVRLENGSTLKFIKK